ncbi:helix-turn-helix domain-containing protein [Amycolatopsis sp. NPDC101161]|uniref:AraC-like ligand-binding domain-containing protein n=1 Tax=Amycolatopsis sp. NPDC101161 TaxID=3363940 RepID=UPI00380D0E4E
MSGAVQIDAADRPPPERVDYWRSSVCDQFVPLAVEPVGTALRGRVAGGGVAETRLRRIRATRHTFERRTSDIRAEDPGVLHLLLQDRGEAVVEQDGRTATLTQGDLLLYDSSRAFRFRTGDEFQFTICLLPKRLLPLSERVQQEHTARVFSSQEGVGPAAAALLTSMARQDSETSPSQQLALQQAMVSMYVALLSEDGVAGSPPAVHLSMAKSFIVRNLGDPSLSPADIAAACNLSLSYLHRIFANDGTTVVGYLREKRLQAAHRDLTSATVDETVNHIAQRWGITDPAHFSRMFKKHFGLTPGALRRTARPDAAEHHQQPSG